MEPEKQEKIEEKRPILLPQGVKKEKTGRWIIYIAAAAVLVLGIVAIYEMNKNASMNGSMNSGAVYKSITIGGATISAEIADTPATLAQGLSDRTSLPSTSAMLFVFDTPERYEFWMKDMHFPLDFIWVGANMKVVDITKNVPADSYPKLYAPKSSVTYVVEVNAGFVDANKIKIGDTLTIQ